MNTVARHRLPHGRGSVEHVRTATVRESVLAQIVRQRIQAKHIALGTHNEREREEHPESRT